MWDEMGAPLWTGVRFSVGSLSPRPPKKQRKRKKKTTTQVISPTACGALFGARTTAALAGPRGNLVEISWNPGGTLVEPSWNPRGTLPQGRPDHPGAYLG